MGKIFNIVSNKPFKIFYNALVPKKARKRFYFKYYDRVKQDETALYWDEVIDKYLHNQIPKYDIAPLKNELVGKKIIWQYWGQGFSDLPEIVKICFASVDEYKEDYQVIRISDENVKDYINLPEFVTEKRKTGVFSVVYFSDLLRISLLSAYGGVWLDSTILLTDKLPSEYSQYDFFLFSRDVNSRYKDWSDNNIDLYFNWDDDFKVKNLNSVLFSKPNSLLAKTMVDLLLYYWQTQDEIKHYFIFQILLNELKNKQVLAFNFPIVDDTLPHLLQRCINQIYEQNYFGYITSQTPIHKLTIHKGFKEEIECKQTYYGYLKEKYLTI